MAFLLPPGHWPEAKVTAALTDDLLDGGVKADKASRPLYQLSPSIMTILRCAGTHVVRLPFLRPLSTLKTAQTPEVGAWLLSFMIRTRL